MHILLFIVFGLAVGFIARFLMPGRQSMGLIMTAVFGMAGSFVGAFIGNLIRDNGGNMETSDPYNWIGAILGTLLLLFIYGRMSGRTA